MIQSLYIYVSGLIVELNCHHYDYIKFLCKDFLLYCSPRHVDIRLEVSEKELNNKDELPGGFLEPEANREFYLLHRKMRVELLKFNSVVLHGVGVSVNNQGLLFSASSGIGKSTQADLLKDFLGEIAVIINDDWPILRVDNNQVFISGSPWCGHRNVFTKLEVPLQYIFFLERSNKPDVYDVSESEIITELIKRSSMLFALIANNPKLYDILGIIAKNISFKRACVNLNYESVKKILSSINYKIS